MTLHQAASHVTFFKEPELRSEAYLAWVRTQPSVISGEFTAWNMERGNGVNEAHHVIGHGRLGNIKTSDFLAIPLTKLEHAILHAQGWDWWEEQHGNQLEHSARMLLKAIAAGVLKINGRAAKTT